MTDDTAPDQASLFPKTPGERLREAREAQNLSLTDIAHRTRVPIRHLEAIEEGRFDTMPSPTYAIGFAKSYARAVGLDERAIADELRNNPRLPLSPAVEYETFELDDPKRLPSWGLAVFAGVPAVLLLIAMAIWFGSTLFRGSNEPAVAATPEETPTDIASATPTPAATPETGGQVTLTATDSVWLRVYDATGKRLFEKTMIPGERYDVPQDADNPMINVGRPDKLQVSLNGAAIPPLGDGSRAIKDVGVGAAAIRARAAGQPAPGATPAPSASTSPATAAAPRRNTAGQPAPAPASPAPPATDTAAPDATP